VNGPILAAAKAGRAWIAAHHAATLGCFAGLISSGAASLGSGLVLAATSYAVTSWLTILLAVLPALLALILPALRNRAALVAAE